MMGSLYAQRDRLSWLAALLVAAMLLSPWLKYRATPRPKPAEDAITIHMAANEDTSVAEPVPAPKVVPKAPPPTRSDSAVQPEPAPAADNTSQPAIAPTVNEAPRPPAPIAPSRAEPTAAPPPVNAGARAEDNYIAGVRTYLISIKHYPTGREASIQKPRGKARVWFVLARDGRLQDAGIEESSDSLLLDRTAIATVQRGGFPAFPDAAWNGQATHRFVVELEFIPGG